MATEKDPEKKSKAKSKAKVQTEAGEQPAESQIQETNDLNPENPHGLYEEPQFSGPPTTYFERFRRWSHRNKRWIYTAFVAAIMLSFVVIIQDKETSNPREVVDAYFGRFAVEIEDWQYNIERYYIDKGHLNNLYPVLAKLTYGEAGARPLLNDRELYESFIREQYEVDLLAFAALREQTLNNAEARLFLENSLRQAAADYYLFKQVGTEATDFRVNVTDAEAREYYGRNKEFYASSGLNEQASLQIIKNTLAGLRRDQMRQQLAVERSRLVARLKDRFGPRLNQD
ncbi:MAG: hypothetical protein NXI24_24910 [bacterium]|nr:hypothetical protein [bacterium]